MDTKEKKYAYPADPDPYTIELEVTNYCNAKCIFCAHEDSKRKKGYMDTELFEDWIKKMREIQDMSWMNAIAGEKLFPKISFGGLGEALLHPELEHLIEICQKYGYRTQIITNGLLLNDEKQEILLRKQVDEIAISLHSVSPHIYNMITGLPFDTVLQNVTSFLDKCNMMLKRPTIELWRVMAPYGCERDSAADERNYKSFTEKYLWLTVLGPSEPWSRDETVAHSLCNYVNDDPNMKIWCHKIWFTINLAWDGTLVLCCNDYNRISIPLGNAFSENWSIEDYNQQKKKIISDGGQRPQICKACKRWPDKEFFETMDKITKERNW